MIKITTEEWIEKAKGIHNNKYDYSLVEYKGQSTLIKIICPEHGEFEQIPKVHIKGSGCQKCSGKQKWSLKDFIKESNDVHNNKYDYTFVDYINNTTKICIICPEHGEFWQTPKQHLKGCGCQKCGVIKRSTSRKSDFKEVISQMLIIHNNFYSYPEQDYINNLEKIKIICPKHGEFYQSTGNHLRGHGCPKCKGEITSNFNIQTKSSNIDEFILKANIIHKFKYDYSKSNYSKSGNKLAIICEKHGLFEQSPDNHLKGHGCPVCNYSKGELLIYNWLKENNIPFKPQFELITNEIARNSNLIIIDFFVKYGGKQYFIEYDGIQHFEYIPHFHQGGVIDFEKQIRRDKVLNEFCELHKDKVTLIRFNYNESNEEVIKKLHNINSQSSFNSEI